MYDIGYYIGRGLYYAYMAVPTLLIIISLILFVTVMMKPLIFSDCVMYNGTYIAPPRSTIKSQIWQARLLICTGISMLLAIALLIGYQMHTLPAVLVDPIINTTRAIVYGICTGLSNR